MTQDILTGLLVFAFVTSIPPGPNNLMLTASGANFGLRRSVPHMLGVTLGFGVMAVIFGAGLAQLFDRAPAAYLALKAASVAYMLWLAWKIAHAAPPDQSDASGSPLGFLQASLFQWVNPKAWAMALTAVTVYAPDRSLIAIALASALFGAVNLPCITVWVVAGQQMRRILTNQTRLSRFNIVMALLLVASLYPVLTTQFSPHGTAIPGVTAKTR